MHYAAIRYNLQKTQTAHMDSDSQADSGGYSDEVLRRGLSDCRKRFWVRKDFKDQQRDKHFGGWLWLIDGKPNSN